MAGPILDPWTGQASYAPALLNVFKWMLQSPGYVERLKKHYQLFRAAVDQEFANQGIPPAGEIRRGVRAGQGEARWPWVIVQPSRPVSRRRPLCNLTLFCFVFYVCLHFSPPNFRLTWTSQNAKSFLCGSLAGRQSEKRPPSTANGVHYLNPWYEIAKQADWKNFAEVRNSWRNSDVVGRFVVFDISHNRCRLIATIKYRWRMVYIRRILSHPEYDEKEWQKS